MHDTHQQSVDHLLSELGAGSSDAFDQMFPLVYDELHCIAERQRRRWQGDETLDTTALVNEAYLRLVDQSAPAWRDRAHFLAVAATAMRQILIDYAKRRRAAKRGGGARHVALHQLEAVLGGSEPAADLQDELLVALDDALRRLDGCDQRQTRIVECRFFAGMSIEETAEALGVSPATVKRGWSLAQAWLYRDLRAAVEDRL